MAARSAGLGALIAPRPLKIVNASKDGAFPPEGYRKLFEMLRPVYGWHGAEEKISEFELPTGHSDVPPYRKAANEWLVRWLTGKTVTFDETERDIELAEPEQLRVLKSSASRCAQRGHSQGFHRQSHGQATQLSSGLAQQENTTAARTAPRKCRARSQNRKCLSMCGQVQERVWTTKYADSFNVEFTTERGQARSGAALSRNGKASHPALIYAKGEDDVVFTVITTIYSPHSGLTLILY